MLQKIPVIKNLSSTQKAIAITVGLILVYESIGYIPLTFLFPDINLSHVGPDFKFSSIFNVFGLGIYPALEGFFLVEMLSFVLPTFKHYRAGGLQGRQQLTQWSLIVSLLLAAFHASTIIRSYNGFILPNGRHLLENPSLLHQGLLGLTLVLGFVMLCGLAELITRHGIGNGFAVIISYGILFSIPLSVYNLFAYDREDKKIMGQDNIMTGEPPNLVGILIFIFLIMVLYKKFWRGVPLTVLYKKFWHSVPALCKRIRPAILKTKMKKRRVDFQLPYLPQGVFPLLWAHSMIDYSAIMIFGWQWPNSYLNHKTWSYWYIYTALLIVISFLTYALISHPKRITHNIPGTIKFQTGWEKTVWRNALGSIFILSLVCFLWNTPLGVGWGKSIMHESIGLVSMITLAAMIKDVTDQYHFTKNARNPRVLETFDNVHFVTCLKGLFEAEGIRFCVQAFEYRRLFYFFEPLIKMRILVDSRDWKKAKELADLENVTII